MVSTRPEIVPAPRQGFQQTVDSDSPCFAKVLEWDAKSIPIEDLRFEKLSIRDIPNGEMPTLPLGFFVKEGKRVTSSPEGNGHAATEEADDEDVARWQRLNTFTVHPDIGKGLFSKALGKLEGKGMTNAKNVMKAITTFLAVGYENCPPAIETIGGMPLKEVAKLYGNSAQRMFEEAYIADIATMMVGVRLATRGRTYAATMNCPVRNCSNVCKELCSMDTLNIKVVPDLKNKPIFRVELDHGIFDGMGKIRKVYFSPLKFYQMDVYFKTNVTAAEMLEKSIVAIPESEVYGLSRSSNPFNEDLYDRLESSGEDQRTLIQSLQKIRPGPDAGFKITCECGERELTYPLAWSMQPLEFLYFSNMFPESDD
jgi:hypothetical protein